METEEKQTKETESREPQTKRISIRVERYQHLIEALDDNSKVRRIVVSVLCIGVLLFTALTIIMLSLKSFFPYSDINTSAFGTTTITDEQKQVSYFLFNTADLWANSGIFVKKGDVISVHSSGSSNTAIHHIDAAASKNVKRERNYGPLGERLGEENQRDRLRRQFRIFPNYPSNALIMQVVSPNAKPQGNPTADKLQNFYYIGAQRDNIHIAEDGILHFAVNDIVLDPATISKMMIANLAVMADIEAQEKKAPIFRNAIWNHLFDKPIPVERLVYQYQSEVYGIDRAINMELLDSLYRPGIAETIQTKIQNAIDHDKNVKERYADLVTSDSSFKFGGYKEKDFNIKSGRTELDYYLEYNYKQAWYDDNVGSFLILVEKDNRNRLSHGE